jgi:hypothetical protein
MRITYGKKGKGKDVMVVCLKKKDKRDQYQRDKA